MTEITKLEDIRHKYDDIIKLKYIPKNKMSIINRASQFAPFAALTGYDAAINEAARKNGEPESHQSDEETAEYYE